MKHELTCIVCPNSCHLLLEEIDGKWKVEGAKCLRGNQFAISEMTNPMRSLSSTIRTIYPNFPLLPVKTSSEVPKSLIFPIMEVMRAYEVNYPVLMGDVIIKDILGSGVDIIASCNLQNPYGGGLHE